jgi:hypothetical protein
VPTIKAYLSFPFITLIPKQYENLRTSEPQNLRTSVNKRQLQGEWSAFHLAFVLVVSLFNNSLFGQSIITPVEFDYNGSFVVNNALNTGADSREDGNYNSYSVWCWDGETPGFGWNMNGTTFWKELQGNNYVSGLTPEDPDIVMDNSMERVAIVYKLQGRILFEGWSWDIGTSEFWPSWGPYELNTVYEEPEMEYPNIDSDKFDQIVIVMQTQASFGHTPEVLAITADFGGNFSIMNIVSDKAGYPQGKVCVQPDVSIYNPGWVGPEEAVVNIIFRFVDSGGDKLIVQQALFQEIEYDANYNYSSEIIHSSSSPDTLTRPRIASHIDFMPDRASWAAVWEESHGSSYYIMLKSSWRYNSSNQFPNTNWFSLPPTLVNDLGNDSCENIRPCITFINDFIIVPWQLYNCLGVNDLEDKDIVVRHFNWETDIAGSQYDYSRLNGGNNSAPYLSEDQLYPSIAARCKTYEVLYLYINTNPTSSNTFKKCIYKHVPSYSIVLKKEKNQLAIAYPNPFSNGLLIDFTSIETDKPITIYNTMLQPVEIIDPKLHRDINPLKLNLDKLKSGTYYVHIEMINGQFEIIRVVKSN